VCRLLSHGQHAAQAKTKELLSLMNPLMLVLLLVLVLVLWLCCAFLLTGGGGPQHRAVIHGYPLNHLLLLSMTGASADGHQRSSRPRTPNSQACWVDRILVAAQPVHTMWL
jgi:hypothetical protein